MMQEEFVIQKTGKVEAFMLPILYEQYNGYPEWMSEHFFFTEVPQLINKEMIAC